MLPIMIGDVITKFLDDSIDDKVYETMSKIAENYSVEKRNLEIGEAYSEFLNQRTIILEKAISDFEERQKLEEVEK